jgi:DNA-binding MltR family transcriptional regulator
MPLTNETLKRTEALLIELKGQSDRGTAIVGVAWVEEELQAAIESYLEKDKKAWDRLFGRSGPLASLSSKIDLARLLGMSSKMITSDLHILRDLRNEFAHTVAAKDNTVLTFNSPHIKDKCLALKCVAHESISEPRVAFVRACAILNADFYMHRFFGQGVSSGGLVHAKIEADG